MCVLKIVSDGGAVLELRGAAADIVVEEWNRNYGFDPDEKGLKIVVGDGVFTKTDAQGNVRVQL